MTVIINLLTQYTYKMKKKKNIVIYSNNFDQKKRFLKIKTYAIVDGNIDLIVSI